MKITNLYHKALSFEIEGRPFHIEPKEVKIVDDKFGKILLRNHWIIQIKSNRKKKGRRTLRKKS